MNLLKIFDLQNNFDKICIPSERVKNIPNESCTVSKASLSHNESGVDYVKEYVEEENILALKSVVSTNNNHGKNFDEVSIGSVSMDDLEENSTKIYDTFNFEYQPDNKLPIIQSRKEILSTIETHSITIIEGIAGCGKSTQVPQFILDSSYKQRKHCNIIVTQPRKIAVLSIAERVCKERGWKLGTVVGYQVGMHHNISSDTRLTYCTTGILLRKLVRLKNMLDFTHIILDEVHERDEEMDFLLLIIRKLLRTNSRQVKIILMSATFNVKKFSEYFSVPTKKGFVTAPIITIPKKNEYKVHVHYLCQLKSLGDLPEVDISKPYVTKKMMKFCIKLINVFDDIDYNNEYDRKEIKEKYDKKPKYAVLVFLPGLWEIEQMYNLMCIADESSKWDIVIMHSYISYEEQIKLFSIPSQGCRRIILSTNITESSITINDIKYVIDFCLTKELVTKSISDFECLKLIWASKVNCEQRTGRVGRLMDGRVYRLIPKDMYEMLKDEATPKILNTPLEYLVLQTKLLDMGEPKALLALGMDPPDLTNLERTILLLKETGGLINKFTVNNKFDGELTNLGRIMAALPLDIRISKLIALGHVFNVLRDTIIIGATISVKNVFSNTLANRTEEFNAKRYWTNDSTSDCLAFLNVYSVWQYEIRTNRIKKRGACERSWARRNFIEIKAIHEVDYLVEELTQRLKNIGIQETVGPQKIVLNNVEHNLILKIVIAGAFYPNYFVRDRVPDSEVDDVEVSKALNGLDPMRTVYFTGWNTDHPGKLYSKRIQEIFKDIIPSYDQTIVEFDASKRVYLLFSENRNYDDDENKNIFNRISPSVYTALKMKQIKNEVKIPVLDLNSADRMMKQLNISTNNYSVLFNTKNYLAIKKILPTTLPILPGLEDTLIPINIVNIEDPGKFWVQINDRDTKAKLKKIDLFLNDRKNITLSCFKSPPSIGSLAAAKWIDNKIYRVIVESYYKLKDEDVVQVLYIDFGYRRNKKVTDLRVILNTHEIFTLEALALQCRLACIEPSKEHDSKDLWSPKSTELLKQFVEQPGNFFGLIYSVVDSITSLHLLRSDENNPTYSVKFDEVLKRNGLACDAEENYSSKYNYRIRQRLVNYHSEHKEYLRYLQYDKNYLIRTYPDPPNLQDCNSVITLNGPYSPLEITLSSLAIASSSKKVIVNSISVNSVLLDSKPEDPREYFVVASTVKQNQSGKYLSLHNTTLIPNISGLTSLICLIFAPKIELRTNDFGTYFVGALCGLGCDKKKKASLMPEHDLEIYFDTEISIQDILNINRLRYWMNMGIHVKTYEIEDLNEQALQCQYKVYEILNKLLNRPLKPLKPKKIKNFAQWELYDKSLLLYPNKEVIKLDSIYPLHCALQLKDRDEKIEDLKLHLEELRFEAISDVKLQENVELYCKLCQIKIYGRENLRSHLFDIDHKKQEQLINIKY